MSASFLLMAVFLPIIGGILIAAIPFKNRNVYIGISMTLTLLTSAVVWALLLNRPSESAEILRFAAKIVIRFKVDGLSMVFAGLVSVLWPLAVLYSSEYMKHERGEGKIREKTFFAMYIITYGVTLGIAFAENMMTMYCFYESLTLVTIPLIMYTMSREAIYATRTYLTFSLGGAAFGFLTLVFMLVYGDTISFVYGGSLNPAYIGSRLPIIRLIYVFGFFGFGVKAAVFPVNSWLPKAGVAPTPVTALLHAVAVVKSGAFAIMRLTYYAFGTDLLKDSFAQYVPMAVAAFTIIFGCSMAVKERHIKRRLAYSTISNLSYILFGVTLMSPAGLLGALCHMLFHGVMKICSFFTAGAVITREGKQYVDELEGIGKRMPLTFVAYTFSALALMGVPGLCGFIGKWYLAKAALEEGTTLAYIGIAALLISAILTATYMLEIVIKAFYPVKGEEVFTKTKKNDPTFRMLIPLFIFVALMIYFGVHPTHLLGFLDTVAKGVL